ncbi:hypothetical protein [Kibdelosporangium aridum]|uniref:hypothetical protein n=1 Tax=Kibdelosporangium aridum TaxID=2030 RepID=UPI00190ED6A9|nr:hypothetical protein [Kibdelosporangium aridum]
MAVIAAKPLLIVGRTKADARRNVTPQDMLDLVFSPVSPHRAAWHGQSLLAINEQPHCLREAIMVFAGRVPAQVGHSVGFDMTAGDHPT